MIILDENIIASQCEKLRAWQIPFRQIGHDVGHQGMDDKDEIIPLLHRLALPTFFTRDPDLYDRALCHANYCLVVLTVPKDEASVFVRRYLRHPEFDTRAKRKGCVARASPGVIEYWRQGQREEGATQWPRLRAR